MSESKLPSGGVNLFQEIKAKCKEAEEKGQTLYRLSIGQPTGPALLSARKAASKAVMSDKESMHEYQDNGSPGVPNFAERFIQAYFRVDFSGADVAYLPIPGIKPMLGLVPLACGAAQKPITVATTTKPGYPTPADWCGYLGVKHYPLKLNVENGFRFSPEDILPGTDVLMLNYPHNPSGQIATRRWWEVICGFCSDNGIRVANDNPYFILSHSEESCCLADVAKDFPDLSWVEKSSASKVIGNGTGWRVGAIVGSSDFIRDMATIKGNTDSGFVAAMAAGALYAIENNYWGPVVEKGFQRWLQVLNEFFLKLRGREPNRESVVACRETYGRRIEILKGILVRRGMKLAVDPKAGFFTLWQMPKRAFGREVESSRDFNFSMIENTGVVGVHFEPDYIRYAVTGDVEKMAPAIMEAFDRAEVSY